MQLRILEIYGMILKIEIVEFSNNGKVIATIVEDRLYLRELFLI